jgi:hypothetical protein
MKILKIEIIGRWGLIPESGDITQGRLRGRELSSKLLDRYLTAGHSPIRRVSVAVTVQAPTEPISHLVRHVHSLHFVQTGRPDLTGHSRDDSKERLYLIQANCEEWMNIAHDRLCNKAAKSTRELVGMIKDSFSESEDKNLNVLSNHMVPSCEYLGRCKEVFNPCGKLKV